MKQQFEVCDEVVLKPYRQFQWFHERVMVVVKIDFGILVNDNGVYDFFDSEWLMHSPQFIRRNKIDEILK
jgi:hypothetical protein